MQSDRIRNYPTIWIIAMAISYCLMAISLVGLPHDHEHDHEHDHANHCSTDCSACFFSANHVGIEFEPIGTTNLDTCISIYPSFDSTSISTTLNKSIQSRAPPVFAA